MSRLVTSPRLQKAKCRGNKQAMVRMQTSQENGGWFSTRMGNQALKELLDSPKANPPNSDIGVDQYANLEKGNRKTFFSKHKIVMNFCCCLFVVLFFFVLRVQRIYSTKELLVREWHRLSVFCWLWWGVRKHVPRVELENTLRNKREQHPAKQVRWWSWCS